MIVCKKIIALIALALVITSSVSAEEYVGGIGTNWVGSAMTLPPGAADLTMHGQIWAGSTGRYQNIKSASGALNLNFGWSRNIELGICQITYMDPNWGANPKNLNSGSDTVRNSDSYIMPGDLSLRFKLGNIPTTMGEAYIIHSFQIGVRYRVAKYSNLPLYPYFGNGNAPSLTWNASWYDRPLYPEESNFFGTTLTYTNHADQQNIGNSAQSIQWGTAYIYPMRNMSVGIQFYGMFFMKTPSPGVFSREPFAYVAPIVNFRLYEGFDLLLSPEILLNKTQESTDFTVDFTSAVTNPARFKDLNNYDPWRLSGILRYRPSTTFYTSDPFAKVGEGRRGAGAAALRERLSHESSQSLFDWTIDSERDLQFLNLDLQKTINERQKAEEELEKLKSEIKK